MHVKEQALTVGTDGSLRPNNSPHCREDSTLMGMGTVLFQHLGIRKYVNSRLGIEIDVLH